ncbi:unnamed protein product [Owenia fusiformis]|uniref:Receptor for retinol uptake STRA6 n=1 Tax=Owenia fusiformis TaxID=6347 RepID=A0A8S4Q0U5_OWEFU|nr:unnamed protein product [Owenia fusiformis]
MTSQSPAETTTSVFMANDSANATTPKCVSYVDINSYFVFNLIPASCVILVLAFLQRRQALCRGCLDGRPGVLSPIDFIQGRSRRFSYAAAYGLTAGLCITMILRELPVKPTPTTPSYLTTFYYVLTVIIYGTNFYPVFAVLTMDTIFSYIIGTLYVWSYSIIFFLSLWKLCREDVDDDMIIIGDMVYNAPTILCCGYLVFSFPIRLIISIRDRNKDKSIEWTHHFQAKYVRRLFDPIPEEKPPPGMKQKIIGTIKSRMYNRVSGYRYSTRMICTTVVTIIVIYMLFSLYMLLIYPYLDYAYLSIAAILETDTTDLVQLLIEAIMENEIDVPQVFEILDTYLATIKVSFVVAAAVAFILVIYNILRSLACYRYDQLKLYRGAHPNLPPMKDLGHSGLMTGFIRFAGYQVAYCAWSFIITQFLLFLVIFVVSCVLIIPLTLGYGRWFLNVLLNAWPAVLVAMVLMIGQMLLSRFAFLQEKGGVLAANNRRWLFIFTYYMFFYNVFLGLFSALKRILFSVLFGTLFMSRMDIASLSRFFERKDPGFSSYLGLLYVEHCHNHPILVTFCNILIDDHNRKYHKGRYASKAIRDEDTIDVKIKCQHGKYRDFKDQKSWRSFKRAQMRWQLVLTLMRAPILQYNREQAIIAEAESERRREIAEKSELNLQNGRQHGFNDMKYQPTTIANHHTILNVGDLDNVDSHKMNVYI